MVTTTLIKLKDESFILIQTDTVDSFKDLSTLLAKASELNFDPLEFKVATTEMNVKNHNVANFGVNKTFIHSTRAKSNLDKE